jgi:hypothetical protein
VAVDFVAAIIIVFVVVVVVARLQSEEEVTSMLKAKAKINDEDYAAGIQTVRER